MKSDSKNGSGKPSSRRKKSDRSKYGSAPAPLDPARREAIARQKSQMPRRFQGIYDRAVKGKSLRAAVNAFCLECVCYQIKEVRNCTDQGCSLYAVRPYQKRPQKGREGQDTDAESTKSK